MIYWVSSWDVACSPLRSSLLEVTLSIYHTVGGVYNTVGQVSTERF